MAAWYCRIDGKEYGPYEAGKLKELVQQSRLGRDDHVRREDHKQWYFAYQVNGLFKEPEPELPPIKAEIVYPPSTPMAVAPVAAAMPNDLALSGTFRVLGLQFRSQLYAVAWWYRLMIIVFSTELVLGLMIFLAILAGIAVVSELSIVFSNFIGAMLLAFPMIGLTMALNPKNIIWAVVVFVLCFFGILTIVPLFVLSALGNSHLRKNGIKPSFMLGGSIDKIP